MSLYQYAVSWCLDVLTTPFFSDAHVNARLRRVGL
jgi:hypothetical protein